MAQKEKYDVLLEEMLSLANVPLNEQGEEEEEGEGEATQELPKISDKDIEKALDQDNKEDDEDDKKSDEPEEELHDEWEKEFRTGSKFRIEFHQNYAYVWYRNKRSGKIQIPDLLRKNKKLLSGFMEKVLSHVEKVS